MYATSDGRIIFSWVEKISANQYALRFAVRNAKGWSEPRTVAEGNNWFVNWADFPSVVALKGDSLAAHWLVKSGSGTYSYDVNISLSNDGGKTWTKPFSPHTDRTQTEHGFVSLLPLADGRLGAVWLDGRNFKDVAGHEESGPSPADMTLRYAAIDAQGKLSEEVLLDERVCECCQTSATLTSEGAIAVYRDRSEGEVRNINFVRQQQNGAWSAPKAVHEDGWEITACPVNGPSIAADGRKVAVAWYTEADDKPRVQIAFSSDAGATFSKPVQVDDGNPIGRVDVLILPAGSAIVSWLSGTAESGAIKVRRVYPDGALGPVSTVAQTEIERSSGFPRIARLGDEVFFAWTDFGKPSRVRMATARVEPDK
ncbi:MAG TPA: hypothetical protein VF544_18080 [Pyrinomonadaceae bacterium]|jgi:hypothetical protein